MKSPIEYNILGDGDGCRNTEPYQLMSLSAPNSSVILYWFFLISLSKESSLSDTISSTLSEINFPSQATIMASYLVTGVARGLGLEIVKTLARKPGSEVSTVLPRCAPRPHPHCKRSSPNRKIKWFW